MLRRVALAATAAMDVALLAATLLHGWMTTHPRGLPPPVPLVLVLIALAAGAVALIACRRANLVLLFLLDFATVLLAGWYFGRLYHQLPAGRVMFLR
ncbi:MAG TPA: hypothetical protein VGV61_08690 [Thermoanaerobaculia bacterium]|nr:hypothetical protein [Thermoanaerobaculia bacterium]